MWRGVGLSGWRMEAPDHRGGSLLGNLPALGLEGTTRSKRCAAGFRRGLVTRSGRPAVGSGRCLVAGSPVPGEFGRRRERMKEGVSAGRQAADNNQAWTAERRMQDCRIADCRLQSAECGSRLAREFGSVKTKAKTGPGCRGTVGDTRQ